MYNLFLRIQTVFIITVMNIVCIESVHSQNIKIIDSISKRGINGVTIRITKNISILSDSNGVAVLPNHNRNTDIVVSHLGYLSKKSPFPKKDTILALTENIIRLGEITISNGGAKQTVIIGNYEKKTNNVFVNSKTDTDVSFTVVNKFNRNNEKINALLFYIAKDENYIKSKDLSPIEIVFFRTTSDGLPNKEPFYKSLVNNYSIGWNKIVLPDLIIENDAIFYGVRWIYNPIKYHYKNITKKKIYPFFGSKLGVVHHDNYKLHQTYFFNIDKGWRTISSIPAMLALEVIK